MQAGNGTVQGIGAEVGVLASTLSWYSYSYLTTVISDTVSCMIAAGCL